MSLIKPRNILKNWTAANNREHIYMLQHLHQVDVITMMAIRTA